MPVTFPKIKSSTKLLPECETIDDYICMHEYYNNFHQTYLKAIINCPKYCTAIQYEGRPFLHVSKDSGRKDFSKESLIWTYKFPYQETQGTILILRHLAINI